MQSSRYSKKRRWEESWKSQANLRALVQDGLVQMI